MLISTYYKYQIKTILRKHKLYHIPTNDKKYFLRLRNRHKVQFVTTDTHALKSQPICISVWMVRAVDSSNNWQH